MEKVVKTFPAEGKKAYLRRMFSDISPRYDFLNRLMSMNLDRRWRRKVVRGLGNESLIADLCAGTGDMALALLKCEKFSGTIVLADFNSDMLAIAREKISRAGLEGRIFLVVADVENLPFREDIFDGAMQGFALRNLESLEKFFSESRRVLKSDKRALFLEISHPENKLLQKIFYFYFYTLLPPLTSWLSGNGSAYRWLPDSLRSFPGQREVVRKLRNTGFRSADYRNLSGGMVAFYQAVK
jgi:demethylmenaquinone methyltransferase/2-methoxy-6-polyprenyl-1,4-benzoquinol methylase